MRMKLRGTITEQSYRRELLATKYHLFHDISMLRFLEIIRENFPAMKAAHTLYWTPEQGEDIITFLVDNHSIIIIELDRYDNEIAPIVDVYPIENFIQGYSKTNQIKIAVALDLAKNDMGN